WPRGEEILRQKNVLASVAIQISYFHIKGRSPLGLGRQGHGDETPCALEKNSGRKRGGFGLAHPRQAIAQQAGHTRFTECLVSRSALPQKRHAGSERLKKSPRVGTI